MLLDEPGGDAEQPRAGVLADEVLTTSEGDEECLRRDVIGMADAEPARAA